MKTLKVLNLYAGIGGNRKLWDTLGIPIEVTAVENNENIAKIYSDFFPNDKVIVADAHQYLLEHYKEFDFIWSSPPCQSHSKARWIASSMGDYLPIYPSFDLWQEIVFLKKFAKCLWVVENVKPYYKDLENEMPIIKPKVILQKHYIWANFEIAEKDFRTKAYHFNTIAELEREKGIKLPLRCYNKSLILKNSVKQELGLHIFKMAFKEPQLTLELNQSVGEKGE